MSVFDHQLDQNSIQLLEVLKEQFFADQPVEYGEFEGQKISDKGNYCLGLRAGPSLETDNLLHEMSHLAEREIPKLLLKPHAGWGYAHGKSIRVAGRYYDEMMTDQDVQREKRVWAYQVSLCKHFEYEGKFFQNCKDNFEDRSLHQHYARSAYYLPGFCNYKYKILTREEIEALGYKDSNEKVIDTLADEILELSQTKYTYENFVNSWFERMDYLKAA